MLLATSCRSARATEHASQPRNAGVCIVPNSLHAKIRKSHLDAARDFVQLQLGEVLHCVAVLDDAEARWQRFRVHVCKCGVLSRIVAFWRGAGLGLSTAPCMLSGRQRSCSQLGAGVGRGAPLHTYSCYLLMATLGRGTTRRDGREASRRSATFKQATLDAIAHSS